MCGVTDGQITKLCDFCFPLCYESAQVFADKPRKEGQINDNTGESDFCENLGFFKSIRVYADDFFALSGSDGKITKGLVLLNRDGTGSCAIEVQANALIPIWVKVASYVTVVIPMIMLIAKLIFRLSDSRNPLQYSSSDKFPIRRLQTTTFLYSGVFIRPGEYNPDYEPKPDTVHQYLRLKDDVGHPPQLGVVPAPLE